DALDDLARGTAGGDHVLHHEARLVALEHEPAAQLHHALFALGEERAHAERARHLVRDEDAADRRRQHGARAHRAERLGERGPETPPGLRGATVGLTPGVTMTHLGPSAPRSNPISRGDATQPSSPASRARSASRSTCDSTLPATPRSSGSAFRSRLVRTVTPITSGRTTPKSVAAFVAASAAARIIARPPDACTSSMNTPSRVASRTAPATVFGMS